MGTQDTGTVNEVFTPSFAAAACYVAGTRIRTAAGEVAIEALREGDQVVSAFGGCAEVIWLGHRHVDCVRHPRPEEVWPVRVLQGAFGPGLPVRDLRLSPDHAVYAEGVLVPIRYLVNGATVARQRVDEVVYWHIELPTHDVVLAEGLPAESYLDTGNRGAFANGGGAVMMHADFSRAVWEAESCARLVCEGVEVAALRRLLAGRAGALGFEITGEPGLLVVAEGRPLVTAVAGGWWRVLLPAGVAEVRLLSRAAVPAEIGATADHRRLGVAVSALRLDGQEVALDAARLGAGWHPVERAEGATWRWTDGDATLRAGGARVLEFAVAITGSYWQAAALGNDVAGTVAATG